MAFPTRSEGIRRVLHPLIGSGGCRRTRQGGKSFVDLAIFVVSRSGDIIDVTGFFAGEESREFALTQFGIQLAGPIVLGLIVFACFLVEIIRAEEIVLFKVLVCPIEEGVDLDFVGIEVIVFDKANLAGTGRLLPALQGNPAPRRKGKSEVPVLFLGGEDFGERENNRVWMAFFERPP